MRYIIILILLTSCLYSEDKIITTPIGTVISKESIHPVINKYKSILALLANGDIESASKLTLNPKRYIAKMEEYSKRVGIKVFKERHQYYLKSLFLHSIISCKNQHLLFVGPDKIRLGSNGFIKLGKELVLDSDMESSLMKVLQKEFEKNNVE